MRSFFRIRFVLIVFLISTLVGAVSPFVSTASAAVNLSLEDKAKSYTYVNAISWCMATQFGPNGSLHELLSVDNVKTGDWFEQGALGVGSWNNNDQSSVIGYLEGEGNPLLKEDHKNNMNCNDIVKQAITLWGYGGDALGLFCSFYNHENKGARRDGTDCKNSGSSGDKSNFQTLAYGDTGQKFFAAAGKEALWNAWPPLSVVHAFTSGINLSSFDVPNLNKDLLIQNIVSFRQVIGELVFGIPIGSGKQDPIKQWQEQKSDVYNAVKYIIYRAAFGATHGCNAKEGLDPNEDYSYHNVSWFSGTTKNIQDMKGEKRSTSRAIFVDTNINTVNNTCEEIANQMKDLGAYYIGYFKNNPSELESEKKNAECDLHPTNPGCSAGAASSGTSCNIPSLGWMICPILTMVAGLNDWMYNRIESILLINPISTQDSNGKDTATYTTWGNMRNIANILLVIAFLIIIFSQVSNIGVTNYGIKKLLPKIIIVAIAINLSFFVMMLAIDAVNLIGNGIYNLINQQAGAAYDSIMGSAPWTGLLLGAGGIGALGAGGIMLITGGETLALMAVVPILGFLIAVVVAFITLYLRNALIVVLVVISPIAFAAYLLPNTQKLFDKWRTTLTGLLMLYPTAAVLFSGAKLAAFIVAGSSGDSSMNKLFALFIAGAPLFMLPWLARQGNSMLAKVNDGLKGFATKQITDRVKKKTDERLDTVRAERAAGMRNVLGGRGWGKSGFGSSMDSRFAKNQQLASDYAKLEQSKARKRGERIEAWKSRVKGINDEQSKLKQQMRMTSGQRKANRQLAREDRVAAAKNMAKANYTTAGLESTEAADGGKNPLSRARAGLDNRSIQNARRFQNQSELATTRLQVAEAQKKSETAARINVPGSEEAGLFAIRKNAEAKTGLSEARAEAAYLRSVNQDTSGRFQTAINTKMAKQATDVYNKEQEGAFQVRLAGSSSEAKELRNRATDANVKIERGQAQIKAIDSERRATVASLRPDLNAISDAKDRTQKFENMEGARIEQRAVDDTVVLQTRAEAEQYKSSQERAQAQAKQIRDEISTDAGRANLRKQLEKRKTAGVRQRQEQERGALAARLFASRGIANNDMSAIADSPELLAFDRQAQQELDTLVANDAEIQAFDQLASTGSVIQGENSAKRGADTASRFATEQQSLEYAKAVGENNGDNDLARAAAGATGNSGRVQASALQEVAEAKDKNRKAARTLLDDQNLTGMQVRGVALDPNTDEYSRLAAMDSVIESGDNDGILQLIENSHLMDRDMQISLAQKLRTSSRPGYIGMGTIEKIAAGLTINPEEEIVTQIEQGLYSPQRLAEVTGDEALVIARTMEKLKQNPSLAKKAAEKRGVSEQEMVGILSDELKTNADAAFNDNELNRKIDKSREAIKQIRDGSGITTDQQNLLNRNMPRINQ